MTRRELLANPRGWIAQEVITLSTSPSLDGERLAPHSQHKHRGESQCKEYKANHGRFPFWSNRPRRHRNPQTRTEPPEKAASNVLDVVTAVSNLNAQDRRPSNECSAITELSQKKV